MEQNRVLGIVSAVGAFLIVVLGVAIILYSPDKNEDPSLTSIQNLGNTWVSQSPLNLQPLQNTDTAASSGLPLTDSSKPNPGTSPLVESGSENPSNELPNSVPSMNVYSEQTTVFSGQTTAIDLNDITRVSGTSVQVPQTLSGTSAAVTKNSTAQTTTSVPAASTSVKSTQPSTAKTTTTAKTTSTPTAKTSSTSTASTTKTTIKAAPVPIPDKYWIQAASFTSKKNAEELRQELANEKITSEIFTFTDANKILYYRVRVGPYSTKSEAEYWQTRVTLVDRLTKAETYITNSSAAKN